MPDTSSHSHFAGSVPMLYDRHLGLVCLEPYAADLAGRAAEGGSLRVLETACGTGIVTRRLLERLPTGGRLTATDLNEGMLAVAATTQMAQRNTPRSGTRCSSIGRGTGNDRLLTTRMNARLSVTPAAVPMSASHNPSMSNC